MVYQKKFSRHCINPQPLSFSWPHKNHKVSLKFFLKNMKNERGWTVKRNEEENNDFEKKLTLGWFWKETILLCFEIRAKRIWMIQIFNVSTQTLRYLRGCEFLKMCIYINHFKFSNNLPCNFRNLWIYKYKKLLIKFLLE